MAPRLPTTTTISSFSSTFTRSFSSTPQCLAKSSEKRLAFEHRAIPPYPYGASAWYKQSNFGLYGLQKIRFGNMVSERNEIKTRRYWRPNVQNKRLWSNALRKFVKTRVTARVLRTIDKVGGLDEYLLGEKAGRVKELGMGGWKLRWRVMQTPMVKRRFAAQREALGLPLKEDVAVGADGLPVSKEAVAQAVEQMDIDIENEEIDLGEDEAPAGEMKFMEEKPKAATV